MTIKIVLTVAVCLFFSAMSQAQLVVDCTGNTPGAYASISAALPSASNGTAIFVVAGPCNESLQLSGWTDLFIGTYNGAPNVAINGGINISDSHGVYLHGLNVTNTTGDGINVTQSQALIIDSCTSNGNASNGLDLGNASEVLVIAPASFDGNSGNGINLYGNSYVQLNEWNGQAVDISNNHNVGVWASQASFTTYGRTNIADNWVVGMQLYGGARVQVGTLAGPNTLTGNQQGGVSVQENSEISFFNFGSQTYIQNNGPVGVSAALGGQVTLYGGVEISGHSGPALDLSGNSQANVFGANNLHNNGVAGDPRSAAIRLDGNSELFLRAGTITQNIGPAILALVSSSADLAGVSFSANSGGIVACDTSSYMVSDLVTGNNITPGVACRTPHTLGNRSYTRAKPAPPDFSGLKARQAKMMARASKK